MACRHRARARATYRICGRGVEDRHGYLGPIDTDWLAEWYHPDKPRQAERKAAVVRNFARVAGIKNGRDVVHIEDFVGGCLSAAQQHNALRRYDNRVLDWLTVAGLQAMGFPDHVRTPFGCGGENAAKPCVALKDIHARWHKSALTTDINTDSAVVVPLPGEEATMSTCARDVLLIVGSRGRKQRQRQLEGDWEVACDPKAGIVQCTKAVQTVMSGLLRQHVGLSVVSGRRGNKRSRQEAGLTVGDYMELGVLLAHHPALQRILANPQVYKK